MSAAADASSDKAKEPVEKEAAEILRLRRDIQATRSELDRYIGELDLRRREILDLKVQARKHPGIVIGVGLAIIAAAGGAVAFARRSRRREPLRRAQRPISRLASVRAPAPRMAGGVLRAVVGSALPLGVAFAKAFFRRREDRRVRSA